MGRRPKIGPPIRFSSFPKTLDLEMDGEAPTTPYIGIYAWKVIFFML
jgi:hypothetical protein